MELCKQHAGEMLGQLIELIERLSPSQYAVPLPILSHSSIGKHVRHIIEFFHCFLQGIENRTLEYDKRERNLQLEVDMRVALETLSSISEQITHLQDLPLNMAYASGNPFLISTSLYRELAYNIEHATHHLAIIKIGIMAHFPQVSVPENLGVAKSTQQHQQKMALK